MDFALPPRIEDFRRRIARFVEDELLPLDEILLDQLTGRARTRAELAGKLAGRGVPDDVAAWIIKLTDPGSDWVTGQVLAVDGGLAVT